VSMIEGEIGVDPFGEDKPRHLGEEVDRRSRKKSTKKSKEKSKELTFH
jgi:hypothetical protein